MTTPRKLRINTVAPHSYDKAGYNWDVSGYAFDPDFLERKSKKKAKAEFALDHYHRKKKLKGNLEARNVMNLKHGKV